MERTRLPLHSVVRKPKFYQHFGAIAVWLESFIDALTPDVLKQNLDERKRVRMFLLSHVFGPLLGLQIPLFLLLVDPAPYPHVLILAASILGFWLFIPLLWLLQKYYTFLAVLSVANLNFTVLWAAFHYGGASSPFLMWYMLLPMLAFFYLGGGARAKLLIFSQILLGLGTFGAIKFFSQQSFPVHIPTGDMEVVGIISAFCATCYAFFMAAYYTQVVDSQSELLKEISRHEATLKMLTVANRDTEAKNIELKDAHKDLEYNALHDMLTGLPNRRYLDSQLDQYARETANQGGSLAVLHIDLDRFKQINDTLGHVAGDVVLNHVSTILKNTIQPNDFVARVGGDEFIVACKFEEEDAEIPLLLAERIIDAIQKPISYNTHLCRVGACVGIAVESGDQIDPARLLINSDIALYRAKDGGRNRAEPFSQELQDEILHTKHVADDILRGLEQGEFCAFYQPQFAAGSFELVGLEALVRWNHPTKGILAPAAFLPIAEELSIAGTIDEIVLQQALTDIKRWTEANIDFAKISVNVSAQRLNEVDLVVGLKKLPILPGTLSFELVESVFLDETDEIVAKNIECIKGLGVTIEIDDFGTGHASIVGLLKLLPSRLKIDRQFVTPILDYPEQANLIGSIIEMGKSLGIEVVAEGVESMEQAALLHEMGVDILQGYALARPMNVDNVERFIIEHTRRKAS